MDNTIVNVTSSEITGQTKPLIRMHHIVKTFENAAGIFPVLKGIDANFYTGEFVGVIGKSGSGKSTLINMMTGIDRPTSGEVYIDEVPVHKLSENQLAVWRGKNIGIVFQFFQLLPTLTLLENIMLPMDFCSMYATRERKERALQLLKMVEMEEHADKLPSAISGGQQQRVAIARALANDPPIIVADEPTGNLDSRTAEAIFQMFESLIKNGKTIVMVTHDSSIAKRATRTILIADGEIVNEWVAKALPMLSHSQMLEATHYIEPVHFEPGQTIMQQGQAGDNFYIITKGDVEIALKRPKANDVVVTRMKPGMYFGEIEMLRGGGAIATARAAESPVEVVAMDRNEFMSLISKSEATRQTIENVISEREKENISARKGNNQ
jgi:ABC-type lipoprotein export system ATPase subunit